MEKLVRDRIIDLSQQKGDGGSFRKATRNELAFLLVKKLKEESIELHQEVSTVESYRDAPSGEFKNLPPEAIEKMLMELVDVYDVLGAFRTFYGITTDQLFHRRVEKGLAKGRFEQGWVMFQERMG